MGSIPLRKNHRNLPKLEYSKQAPLYEHTVYHWEVVVKGWEGLAIWCFGCWGLTALSDPYTQIEYSIGHSSGANKYGMQNLMNTVQFECRVAILLLQSIWIIHPTAGGITNSRYTWPRNQVNTSVLSIPKTSPLLVPTFPGSTGRHWRKYPVSKTRPPRKAMML